MLKTLSSPIRQIILDYDDTTVFSGFRHHQAASSALKLFTGYVISDQDWSAACAGRTHSEIYNFVLSSHPGFASEQEFLTSWQKIYHDQLSTLEARAGIDRLASAFFEATSLKIPIVSNSMKSDVIHGLVVTDLQEKIGSVYGSDTLRCLNIPAKPSPDVFKWITHTHGIDDPASVIVVDDSSVVIQSAKRAGFATASFLKQCDVQGVYFENPPIEEADYNISSAQEEMDEFIDFVISNLEVT